MIWFPPSLLSPLAKILIYPCVTTLFSGFPYCSCFALPIMTPMLISFFFFHSLPLMVCVELFNFCERFRQTQSSGENVREFPSSCPNPNTTSEKETLHMWLHERKRRNLGWKDNTRMKTARPSILSHTVPLKTNLFQLKASHICKRLRSVHPFYIYSNLPQMKAAFTELQKSIVQPIITYFPVQNKYIYMVF